MAHRAQWSHKVLVYDECRGESLEMRYVYTWLCARFDQLGVEAVWLLYCAVLIGSALLDEVMAAMKQWFNIPEYAFFVLGEKIKDVGNT